MFKKINERLANQKFRQERSKINVLTFEEVMWLIIGFGVGLYVGLGIMWMIFLIPVAIIGAYLYELYQLKKYGAQSYVAPRKKAKSSKKR